MEIAQAAIDPAERRQVGPYLLEQIGRSGVVLHRWKLDVLPATLGRAYSNDIIIDDPYVDAVHAALYLADDGTLQLRDLGSVNGSYQQGRKIPDMGTEVSFGSMLSLGKSHLRILDAQSEVPEAIPISVMETLLHSLSRPWMVMLAMLMVFALMLMQSWLEGGASFNWQRNLEMPVVTVLALLAYGGVWALLSRILRHDGRLWGHCMVAILGVIIYSLVEALLAWMAFNFEWLYSLAYMEVAVAGTVVFVILRTNLELATHWMSWRLSLVALVGPLLIVAMPLAKLLLQGDELTRRPYYPATLMPPALHAKGGVEQSAFLEQAQTMFDHLAVESVESE